MERPNEKAYEYVKSRILSGEFHPAERLVESTLASKIGVSRNTVRKALQKLESEKLIVIEENKGASVVALDMSEIQQYYEIRLMLEVMVVKDAAERISDEAISKLEAMYSTMEEMSRERKYDEYSAMNREFHKIIYGASAKNVAVDMILEIKNQLRRFQIRTMMVPGRSDNSLREHKKLLEALKAHDPETAGIAISEHICNVLGTIEKFKLLLS